MFLSEAIQRGYNLHMGQFVWVWKLKQGQNLYLHTVLDSLSRLELGSNTNKFVSSKSINGFIRHMGSKNAFRPSVENPCFMFDLLKPSRSAHLKRFLSRSHCSAHFLKFATVSSYCAFCFGPVLHSNRLKPTKTHLDAWSEYLHPPSVIASFDEMRSTVVPTDVADARLGAVLPHVQCEQEKVMVWASRTSLITKYILLGRKNELPVSEPLRIFVH